jgi:uncharacterized protein with HEPN domain
MHPKSPKWLQDIADACTLILRATESKSLDAYEQDAVVRSAVERNFEIIGEALNRIRRTDPPTAARVPEHDDIIAFRNLLIHGYDVIDHARVWQVIQNDLPRLQEQVQKLLDEVEPAP